MTPAITATRTTFYLWKTWGKTVGGKPQHLGFVTFDSEKACLGPAVKMMAELSLVVIEFPPFNFAFHNFTFSILLTRKCPKRKRTVVIWNLQIIFMRSANEFGSRVDFDNIHNFPPRRATSSCSRARRC